MLLGEYNYTANFMRKDNSTHNGEYNYKPSFLTPEDSSCWAKLVFVIFVFDMSVVLMNLILGMAVSDIDALQKSSEVKRMVNECYIVKTMEEIFYFLGKFVPFLHRYKSVYRKLLTYHSTKTNTKFKLKC